jgi:hypothetical protein
MGNGKLRFQSASAPTVSELNALLAAIGQCVARHLELQGLLTRDGESGALALDFQDDDAMNPFRVHVIAYRRNMTNIWLNRTNTKMFWWILYYPLMDIFSKGERLR